MDLPEEALLFLANGFGLFAGISIFVLFLLYGLDIMGICFIRTWIVQAAWRMSILTAGTWGLLFLSWMLKLSAFLALIPVLYFLVAAVWLSQRMRRR